MKISNRTELPDQIFGLLPVVDLSQQVGEGASNVDVPAASVPPSAEQRLLRALYRRPPQPVIVTGPRGIGKTTWIRDLGLRAAAGDVPFLTGHRVLWIDCRHVGPEDSRACLESIFSAVANIPQVVLCLDGMDALLRRLHGGTNKPLLQALVRRPGLRLIGVMSSWKYNDLVAGDADLREQFVQIPVEEPPDEATREIVRLHARLLAEEHRLTVDAHVADRTLALASTFILSERQPAKSVNILRQVFSDADFERTQRGVLRERITVADVVRVIAEKTGIPETTIAGDAETPDFESVLAAAVVGQDAAVQQMADELRLIKAGLNEPGKPAAVLMFAGTTGVGKTELAKRVAELYSTSRRLQVYAMGNFTEPHSVSGIIGVPPGYVGHEQGGRLINDLNADPYSVFLLDEAEKCHPNIWKPFLNLFDEGWIVDQRGVKAYADRAIFILTTNAGDRQVAQMSQAGRPPEEIAERVQQALGKVRQERSSQPVFPPQFLSRIKRIVVFRPLDEAALTGIAGIAIGRMQQLWMHKREKFVEVAPEVVTAIGRRAHALNASSNGQEGGRIVRRLIGDWVESRIQQAAVEDSPGYAACRAIDVGLNSQVAAAVGKPSAAAPPHIRVEFTT